jgi:hypothetical protein
VTYLQLRGWWQWGCGALLGDENGSPQAHQGEKKTCVGWTNNPPQVKNACGSKIATHTHTRWQHTIIPTHSIKQLYLLKYQVYH